MGKQSDAIKQLLCINQQQLAIFCNGNCVVHCDRMIYFCQGQRNLSPIY